MQLLIAYKTKQHILIHSWSVKLHQWLKLVEGDILDYIFSLFIHKRLSA
jgi:hypothetical protein